MIVGRRMRMFDQLRTIFRVVIGELRFLNNARTAPGALQSLTREERVRRVKAHLTEYHRGQSRCC